MTHPEPVPFEATPLAVLKGASPAVRAHLARLGVDSVLDLLLHRPLRYEDRARSTPLGALQPGLATRVVGQIQLSEVTRGGRRALVCRIADGTGCVYLRFFHFNARQLAQMTRGAWISAFGEARVGFHGLEMIHPDYRVSAQRESPAATAAEGWVAVYPLTAGLRQFSVRALVRAALTLLQADPARLAEAIPAALRVRFALPGLVDALAVLHRPPSGGDALAAVEQARRRLAFEEILAHHLGVVRRGAATRRQRALPLAPRPGRLEEFQRLLPFQCTGAQRRVMGEVLADLARTHPMSRLVQGDVGAGKTVVAAAAALAALDAGAQVAVMVPTELLAEQHATRLAVWLEPLGGRVACLTGRVKGVARRRVLGALASGSVDVVVGTHALFQDAVLFQRLGLVVIDEQHRFGVRQRLALRAKGADGRVPHQMVMTATPIPRTLAMLSYADMAVSLLDELPPGRTPVVTTVLDADRRDAVVTRIAAWAARGRQAYWVCPLIEESEALDCEAAESTARQLAEALPGLAIGLAHGRMASADKLRVMAEFQRGALDLLVATTVIEVGVDVPNAGLMVIDNAERLGLAQLHQLRGRVGRGPGEAHCVLLYRAPLAALARERLALLRETADGFLIAEKDLELRGPGEVLGTRQSGQALFRCADLARDRDLIDAVRTAGAALLRDDPAGARRLIERWLGAAARFKDV